MKIVCANSLYQAREAFSSLGDTLLLADTAIGPGDVACADALIVRSKTVVDRNLLEGSRVRFVGTATAGTDHLDLDYLNARRIAVASAPGCNANSVAEYTIAAILHLADRYNIDLTQKTIGLIGAGAIGSLVAEKCWALGMHVMLNDPPLYNATRDPGYQPLDDLLDHADLLSFHVPLTRDGRHPTAHMVDIRMLSRIRPGAFLLNTSRGEIIRSEALISALEQGLVAHAALDVFEHEPTPDPGLIRLLDIATPHIAGHSIEGKLNGTEIIYRALCNFEEVEPAWTPDPLPEPEHPLITLDARALTDEEALCRILAHAHPLKEDDQRLRATLDEPPSLRAERFREMRAAYPARREFAAYSVQLHHPRPALMKKIAALGFHLPAP